MVLKDNEACVNSIKVTWPKNIQIQTANSLGEVISFHDNVFFTGL